MTASFFMRIRAIALLAAAVAVIPVAAAGLDRDDRWTDAERAVLASLTLAALPPVPSDPIAYCATVRRGRSAEEEGDAVAAAVPGASVLIAPV